MRGRAGYLIAVLLLFAPDFAWAQGASIIGRLAVPERGLG